MRKPTMLSAEQAAEALGIDTYELHQMLLQRTAEELQTVASDILRGHPMELARARRFFNAAEAAHQAWLEVEKAEAETA